MYIQHVFNNSSDQSLTVERVTPIFRNLKKWVSIGMYRIVPNARADIIRRQYSSLNEQQTQAAFYYVNCFHVASWSHLATWLYRDEESAAIEAFRLQQPKGDLSVLKAYMPT